MHHADIRSETFENRIVVTDHLSDGPKFNCFSHITVGGVIFCWIFYFPFQRKCVSCFQPKSWYSILCRGQLSHFRKLSDWLHLIQVFFQEVSRANNFKRKLVIKDSEAAFSGNIQIEMRGMDIEASLSQTSFLHLQKQELSVAVLLNCAIWDILQKLASKLFLHNFIKLPPLSILISFPPVRYIEIFLAVLIHHCLHYVIIYKCFKVCWLGVRRAYLCP